MLNAAEVEIIGKLLFSAVLGLIVGLERQVHGKPAGMRTLSLVAMGSTLFTAVSFGFGFGVDPSRVAAGIVTGIGFLGAGTIFKSDKRVQGLTTATELWVIAAMGIAVGIGMYLVAMATTLIVLIVIIGGRNFEIRTEDAFRRHRKKNKEEL